MKTREQNDWGAIEWSKKYNPWVFLTFSAILFIAISIISTVFFFKNSSLSKSIVANNEDIVQYNNSIEKIKSDKNNIRAELTINNKSEILATIKANEAQSYIIELHDISKKYKMIFSGFSYGNGKVTTSATSIPETVLAMDDGVKKISSFIKDYRTEPGLLFDLSPILSISWYEQKRLFSIQFNSTNISKK